MNSLSSSLSLLCPSPRHSWWRRHWHWRRKGGSQIQLRASRAAASVWPPSLAETHLVPSSICPPSWCTYHRRRDSVSIIIPLCLSSLISSGGDAETGKAPNLVFCPHHTSSPQFEKVWTARFPPFPNAKIWGKGEKVWCYFNAWERKRVEKGRSRFSSSFPLRMCVCIYLVPHSVSQHYIAGNNSPQLSCAKILFFSFSFSPCKFFGRKCTFPILFYLHFSTFRCSIRKWYIMWEIARILRNARKEMGMRACGGQMITHASFTTWETAANNGQFISPYLYVSS